LLPRQAHTVGDHDRLACTTDTTDDCQTPSAGAEDQLRSPTASSNAAQAPGDVPAVLYIDDDAMVRCSTEALLRSFGMSVANAVDGPSGLQRLETSFFHLVICDQGLPGMDGIAVLNEIKCRHPDLPVVIVSGWSLAEIGAGVRPDDFLEKPFAADELIDVLQRHLPAIPTV
jgi:CheY-like chemotaxis protein